MKTMISLLGLLLIIFGVYVFAYKGFTYTKQENIAQIGDLKVTTDTQEHYQFSPILGGLALVAGIGMIVIGRRK